MDVEITAIGYRIVAGGTERNMYLAGGTPARPVFSVDPQVAALFHSEQKARRAVISLRAEGWYQDEGLLKVEPVRAGEHEVFKHYDYQLRNGSYGPRKGRLFL